MHSAKVAIVVMFVPWEFTLPGLDALEESVEHEGYMT
jgi:hypothetical protein